MMSEYLENTRAIIPYCVSCIAEKRVIERKQLEESLKKRKKTASEIVELIFSAIGMVIKLLLAAGLIGWMFGLLVGAIIIAGGIFLAKYLGYDEKIINDNAMSIYIASGISVVAFSGIAAAVEIKKEKRKNRKSCGSARNRKKEHRAPY